MADIPVSELILDVRNYLRWLAPEQKTRKAALLLSQLADTVERLQASISKLPKLGDGVAAYPEQPVWKWSENRPRIIGGPFSIAEMLDWGCRIRTPSGVFGCCYHELFSARKAAGRREVKGENTGNY